MDSDSDTKAKKSSRKKRKPRTPRKRKTETATGTKKQDTAAKVNEAEAEEEEDIIDATLIEQERELRKKIANQNHIAEIAELQCQYEALLAEPPSTNPVVLASKSRNLSVNSSDVTSGNGHGQFMEEQIVDALEVQEFLMEEAKAERLAICYGCKEPGHIRANCPDVTNRYSRPRRLFKLC